MDPFLETGQHNKLTVDEKLTAISLYEEVEESEEKIISMNTRNRE